MPRGLANLVAVAGATAAAIVVLAALMALGWTAASMTAPAIAGFGFTLFLFVAWLGAILFGATGWLGIALPIALLAFATSAIVLVSARRTGRADRAFYLRRGGWAGFFLFLLTCAAPLLLQSVAFFGVTAFFWGVSGMISGVAAGAALHIILWRVDPEMARR